MNNAITTIFEAAAFLIMILAFVALWAVTPAHAGFGYGSRGQCTTSCNSQSCYTQCD